ncbi:MAG: RCC1 domain-containing protein [Actinomycetota bacterium]
MVRTSGHPCGSFRRAGVVTIGRVCAGMVLAVLVSLLDAASTNAMDRRAVAGAGAASDKVWGWGRNDGGQLGDGTKVTRMAPVRVGELTGIVDVAAGHFHSLAVGADGTVWSWGEDPAHSVGMNEVSCEDSPPTRSPVQVDGLADVAEVSTGDFFSVARKSDGTVWAWGLNHRGVVGSDDVLGCDPYPAYFGPRQVGGLSEVVEVDVGTGHTLALKSDGTVWSWGGNDEGELGDGTTQWRSTPGRVDGLIGIVDISAGPAFNLALSSDGSVWAWGRNYDGQLGDGTTTDRMAPVRVSGLSDVVSVEGGGSHSLAILSSGTVQAWGGNANGELGNGTRIDRSTPGPVQNLTKVVQVSADAYHGLAVRSDGSVWAWGMNMHGEIGDDSDRQRRTPVQVRGLKGAVVASAGASYSLAVAAEVSRSQSHVTMSLSKTPRDGTSRVQVRGTLSPKHPGLQVDVTLFEENSAGVFRVKEIKRPTLDDSGDFATSLRRRHRGTCKVVVAFPGDADHLPSKVEQRFSC